MATNNLEAVANYKQIFKQIGRFGGIVGVNMVQPNYKPSLLTILMLSLNISLTLSSLYTMVFYDAKAAWLASNNIGMTLQGLIKYYVLMKDHKRIFAKVQFLGQIYHCNTSTSSLNLLTLRTWSMRLALFSKYGIVLFGATSALFIGWAAIVTTLTEDKELILYFMLPGVDHLSWTGYFVLSCYHLLTLALGIFGTCGADFMLVVLVFHLWPLSDILDNMCNEMNAALLEESNRNTAEMRAFFYNLLRTHQDICEYLEDLSKVYFPLVFVECYTCALTLCTLLYCISTMVHYPLYMMCVLFFVSLLIYCFLGTVAELAMDRVYRSLLCSKWYLLPIAEQKCVCLMIAKAQNPVILMAGAVPLNLDTFVQLMKTVYSVGMLLLRSSD